MNLPPLLPLTEIQNRLQDIFPEGTPHRANCVSPASAKTIFVMLYLGALEGRELWIRPDQVSRMSDAQALKVSDDDRLKWRPQSLSKAKMEIQGRWYAVNTRESVRDDAIRNGLALNGAVLVKSGVATTSSAGRYALQMEFAEIFNPGLKGSALASAIQKWQTKHLSAGARARIAILKRGSTKSSDYVSVTLPNGETRLLSAGPSSEITKKVVEDFAPRFLTNPAVLFISESGNKVITRDDELAKSVGLNIDADKNLPDVILADVAHAVGTLFVFEEVGATDGPISESRKDALLKKSKEAGFPPEHIAFVTAYLDRSRSAFKKSINQLAWGSYAWFASEPDGLLILTDKLPTL